MKHFVWISFAAVWLIYGAHRAHQHYIVEIEPPSERAQLIIDSMRAQQGWKYSQRRDSSPKLHHAKLNLEVTSGIIAAEVDRWISSGQSYQSFSWADRYWINQTFNEVIGSYKALEKKGKTEAAQQEAEKMKEILKEK